MSTQESESALSEFLNAQKRKSWGEERVRNLGATVESLIRSHGYDPRDLVPEDVVAELTQDDFGLAA